MIQPDLFAEPVTPPVVALKKAGRVTTKEPGGKADIYTKAPARTAAHCRQLALDGEKAGCSQEWCDDYRAEADAIDAAHGLQPLRKSEPASAEVEQPGASEWQKFLEADPRRRVG